MDFFWIGFVLTAVAMSIGVYVISRCLSNDLGVEDHGAKIERLNDKIAHLESHLNKITANRCTGCGTFSAGDFCGTCGRRVRNYSVAIGYGATCSGKYEVSATGVPFPPPAPTPPDSTLITRHGTSPMVHPTIRLNEQ